MIVIDLLVMGLLCLALVTFRNRQLVVTLCAYSLTVLYSSSPYFDAMPSWYNHIVYVWIMFLFVFISSVRGAVGLGIYMAFQLVASIDHFIYPSTNTLISDNFSIIHSILAFSIIYLSIDKGAASSGNSRTVLDHLFRHMDAVRYDKIHSNKISRQ